MWLKASPPGVVARRRPNAHDCPGDREGVFTLDVEDDSRAFLPKWHNGGHMHFLDARTLAVFLILASAIGCGAGDSSDAQKQPIPEPPVPALVAGGLDQEDLKDLDRLTAAVQRDPESHKAWAALARSYESLRVPAGAHVSYAAAASLNPADPKLMYRAAIMASRNGDTNLALERVEAVLKIEDSYGPAWRRKGTWLLDVGQAEEARLAFERAEALLPEYADAPLGLASTALAQDDVEAALRFAQTALERAPDDAYARNILGNALRRAGRMDEAKPHLIAGQNSVPRYVDPWSESSQRASRQEEGSIARVESLLAEKEWDQAINLLREMQRGDPTNSKLPLRIGIALMRARRINEAVEHYRSASIKFPANYDLQTASVAALNASGRASEGVRVAEDVIRRWPDRAPAYLQKGAALSALGDVDAARAAFQRSSQLKPSDLRGPLFEGKMLARLRRFDEAADVLETALDLPGASAPMTYFEVLIAARAASGADLAHLKRITARARKIHGAAADTLLP